MASILRQFIDRLRQAGGNAATAADMLDTIIDRGDVPWLVAEDNPPFDDVEEWIQLLRPDAARRTTARASALRRT